MKLSYIKLKISCVITEINAAEVGSFLEKCRKLGVWRVVLRKLYGERRTWRELLIPSTIFGDQRAMEGNEAVRAILAQAGRDSYRGNPVVVWKGVQVTLWDFMKTQSSSLNLFSNGLISERYLLTQAEHPTTMRTESAENKRNSAPSVFSSNGNRA